MNVPVLLAGILVVAFVFVDSLWTTLWVDGRGGPLSRALIWGVGGCVRARLVPRSNRMLSIAGPLTLALTLFAWSFLLWVGWSLVFFAGDGALERSAGSGAISVWDAAYYAGYTIFTLGIGDVRPVGAAWQMVTVVAVASGLLLVSVGVTYVVTIVGAVVGSRALANRVLGAGRTPQELLLAAWAGDRFPSIGAYLAGVGTTIARSANQHLAYPVLHTYHAARPENASPLALAVLDEALTLLEHGVADDVRPDPFALRTTRASVRTYLDTLATPFGAVADGAPPVPDLDPLRAAGVPVVDDATFAERVERIGRHRARVRGLVEADHWSWDDVTRPSREV